MLQCGMIHCVFHVPMHASQWGSTSVKPAVTSRMGQVLDAASLAGTRVLSQGLQFVLFVFAARVLSAAEFGVFSVVFAATVGLTVLAEAGWREYVICCEDTHAPPQLNAVSLVSGSLLAGLLLLGCSAGAVMGLSSDFTQLGGLLAFWVGLRPLAMVQVGLLTRQAKLRALAVVQLVSEVSGFLLAAATLWAGYGVMSLAIGKIALLLAELGGSLICTQNFRVRWPGRDALGHIVTFSRGILGARVLQFAQGNYSTLAVGVLFAPASVGIYRAAIRLVGTAQEVVREPAKYIGWSSLLRARDSGAAGVDQLPHATVRFVQLVGLTAAPALVLMALAAEPLITLLLGPKWLAAAPLLSILPLAAILRLVAVAIEPVMALRGSPHLVQRNAAIIFTINLVCFAIAVPFGLTAIAWSELVAAAASVPLTVWLMHRHGNIPATALLKALMPTTVACLLCWAGAQAIGGEGAMLAWSPVWQIAAIGAIVLVIQALVLALFYQFAPGHVFTPIKKAFP